MSTEFNRVRTMILAKFADSFREKGVDPSTVADDFDLLGEGLVDSMGLVELITEIEDFVDREISFDDVEAERITLIGTLCRLASQESPSS